jgi:voltage-gated potassium channel
MPLDNQDRSLREWVRHIIFDSDDHPSRLFDVTLIISILISVAGVLLISMPEVEQVAGGELLALEWAFTILFTLEYGARLWSARDRKGYALSFFGIIDLMAIAPTYLSFFIPGAHYLIVIRALRTLRVFRILKLLEYVDGSQIIITALRNSRAKIIVFMTAVVMIVTIVGSLMYLVESETNPGYSSIPVSIYWAIVTLTTVGYGDISPDTALGKLLSSIVMLLGYAIIAVPTGIVASEMTRSEYERGRRAGEVAAREEDAGGQSPTARPEPEEVLKERENAETLRVCPQCGTEEDRDDSLFCRRCGGALR